MSSSRWVATQHPGAIVVKAFNTMQSRHLLELGRPAGARTRHAGLRHGPEASETPSALAAAER